MWQKSPLFSFLLQINKKLTEKQRRTNRQKTLHKYNISDKNKANQKRYSQTGQGKIVNRERTIRYIKKHPIKRKRTEQKYYHKSGGKEKRLQRYQNNKEYVHKQNSQWSKNNRPRKRLLDSQYHARKLGAKGTHTLKQWNNLCKKFDYRCANCGKKRKLTEDHIIPLSKGGTNYISNIQPLCLSCNSAKRDRI